MSPLAKQPRRLPSPRCSVRTNSGHARSLAPQVGPTRLGRPDRRIARLAGRRAELRVCVGIPHGSGRIGPTRSRGRSVRRALLLDACPGHDGLVACLWPRPALQLAGPLLASDANGAATAARGSPVRGERERLAWRRSDDPLTGPQRTGIRFRRRVHARADGCVGGVRGP
jgi:hypothetical protein